MTKKEGKKIPQNLAMDSKRLHFDKNLKIEKKMNYEENMIIIEVINLLISFFFEIQNIFINYYVIFVECIRILRR